MQIKKLVFRGRVNGADGGCASCPNAADVATVPPALTGTKTVLPSGVAGWIALRSDISFTNVTLQAEWETYIDDGTMIVRMDGCRVRGSKPDSTTVSKRRGACSVEEVVKRNQVWEILDVGNDDDYTMHDLYAYLGDNWKCFKFGIITCDYRVYGFDPTLNTGSFMTAVSVFVDDNILETNEDDALIKMNITTQQAGLVKPRLFSFLPNLVGLIN